MEHCGMEGAARRKGEGARDLSRERDNARNFISYKLLPVN
jgi:hypothetical protein